MHAINNRTGNKDLVAEVDVGSKGDSGRFEILIASLKSFGGRGVHAKLCARLGRVSAFDRGSNVRSRLQPRLRSLRISSSSCLEGDD